MAEQTGQSYANHRQRAPMWLFAFFASTLALLVTLVLVASNPALFTVGLLLMSSALVATVLMVRGYALRLQDRIIRLEMQTRLARLGLDSRLPQLGKKQIVALRFASDAEMPGLIERAVAEKLDPDQIKKAVSNWQGDYSRV
ncbi:MAG: hypothetical protein FJW14_15990 [Acidimicrobiia bacterium]|nr:hypothetical protein [Acidimicrobiia bacterium]